MKKYRLVNIKRFLLTLAVIIIPTVIIQIDLKSSSAEVPEKVPLVQTKIVQAAKEPAVSIKREIVKEQEDYLSYMTKFEITSQRAQFLLDSIKKTNTNVPTSLVLAMIQKETKFKNIKSQVKTEDSAGYVQMKSKTIQWLKTIYPSLPTVKSQDEFISSPDTQIQYMIKYLEYANNKFNYDFDKVVSSYNMGLDNDRMNWYYVNEVSDNKEAIERFIYKM